MAIIAIKMELTYNGFGAGVNETLPKIGANADREIREVPSAAADQRGWRRRSSDGAAAVAAALS
jgi:hypothetical protein